MDPVHRLISFWKRWYRVIPLVALVALLVMALSFYIPVGYYTYHLRGQHEPNINATILFTPSLHDDILQSVDSTSISQFSVETVRGMMMLAVIAIGTSSVLLLLAYDAMISTIRPVRVTALINSIGYLALALVGIFGTAPPSAHGFGPRRSYNILFFWTVPALATQVVHVISATAYLFVPTISTLCMWAHNPHFPCRKRFVALYATIFSFSCFFVVSQFVSMFATNDVIDVAWLGIEFVTFSSASFSNVAFLLYVLYQPTFRELDVPSLVDVKTIVEIV
jgi:hypothetical protein